MADYCSFKGKECEISSLSNLKICTKGEELWCAKADCIKERIEKESKEEAKVIFIEERKGVQ